MSFLRFVSEFYAFYPDSSPLQQAGGTKDSAAVPAHAASGTAAATGITLSDETKTKVGGGCLPWTLDLPETRSTSASAAVTFAARREEYLERVEARGHHKKKNGRSRIKW